MNPARAVPAPAGPSGRPARLPLAFVRPRTSLPARQQAVQFPVARARRVAGEFLSELFALRDRECGRPREGRLQSRQAGRTIQLFRAAVRELTGHPRLSTRHSDLPFPRRVRMRICYHKQHGRGREYSPAPPPCVFCALTLTVDAGRSTRTRVECCPDRGRRAPFPTPMRSLSPVNASPRVRSVSPPRRQARLGPRR